MYECSNELSTYGCGTNGESDESLELEESQPIKTLYMYRSMDLEILKLLRKIKAEERNRKKKW